MNPLVSSRFVHPRSAPAALLVALCAAWPASGQELAPQQPLKEQALQELALQELALQELALQELALQEPGVQPAASPKGESVAVEAADSEPQIRILERGEGFPPLRLPVGEELDFEVEVQITIIEAAVADCKMTSRFEPYRPPLLLSSGGGGEAKETAVLALHAVGDHLLYSMDALLETRRLPQEWPEVVHRLTQNGTEKRRREILLGHRDGKAISSYRGDTSHGAPRGTRVWAQPVLRDVPEGALDMVSAIFLIRTMIHDGLESLEFPLVNKLSVWDVVMRRGRMEVVETDAGDFRALEILLDTVPDEGSEGGEFEGPFGLKGTIHLWVEATTGVPVLISGDLPAGILTLGVEIRLQGYSGTPSAFQPL